jgi:ferric-dicitrate binding protein FerR (iron transport regulator)
MKKNRNELTPESFPGIHLSWEKSKDEIWEDLQIRMQEGSSKKTIVRSLLPGKTWLAVAASGALLVALLSFMRFHTVSSTAPSGIHTRVELPDGSRVKLNADTRISYKPYWWKFSRLVELEGEAWFDVNKGSRKFRVTSRKASTEVLGTTFNIYARKEQYRVECHSGKIALHAHKSKEQVILTPLTKAQLNSSGRFEVSTISEAEKGAHWTDNRLRFVSTPLKLVFEEIERQYGIEIECSFTQEYLYSGNFSLDIPLENVLHLLCRPFDLRYEQSSENRYIIQPGME